MPVRLQSLICKTIVAVHLPLMDKLLLTQPWEEENPCCRADLFLLCLQWQKEDEVPLKPLVLVPVCSRQGLGRQELESQSQKVTFIRHPPQCPALGQALSHLFP